MEKQSRQQWQQQLDPELAFVEGVVLSAAVVTVVGSTPPQCKGIQMLVIRAKVSNGQRAANGVIVL